MKNGVRKNNFAFKIPLILLFISSTSIACTFHWHHYGDKEIFRRISNEIGGHINHEWCKNYNDKYEIFIITESFNNSKGWLGVGSVGIRRQGSDSTPSSRQSAYRYEDGNYVIGESYNLTVQAAMDAVDDLMSTLPAHIPR
ncbi:hypothetical protein [Paraburkholderia ultramafica]|uniref:hypothetical protein n=1 Tax=Paraburkholderia ultramafica TaxID=1544867 RepID=UPI0015839A69|nr:hypothetical protein [Paraburkholderia ultramafica]